MLYIKNILKKLHYTIRHRVNIYLSQRLNLSSNFINTGKAGQKSAKTYSKSKLKDASNKMGPGERKIF